mgnify:CR=1 FL=1
MKRLIFILCLFPFFTNAQLVDTSGINWLETEHDFGNIPFNKPVTHIYKFVNNSKEVAEIVSVEASCGCTEPVWTKTPIMPKDTAVVEATYKANTEGTFKKQVTIYTNRSSFPTNLILKGVVIRP